MRQRGPRNRAVRIRASARGVPRWRHSGEGGGWARPRRRVGGAEIPRFARNDMGWARKDTGWRAVVASRWRDLAGLQRHGRDAAFFPLEAGGGGLRAAQRLV